MSRVLLPIRLFLSLFLGFSLITGCASTTPESSTAKQQAEEDIASILSHPLSEKAYDEGVRCLPSMNYHSVKILDDQRLVFEGLGDKRWLNQLRNRCPGLRPGDTLRFELTGSRLCEMDTVVAIDRFLYFWERTSATCMLGKFEPVTPDQIDAIKAALKKAKEK